MHTKADRSFGKDPEPHEPTLCRARHMSDILQYGIMSDRPTNQRTTRTSIPVPPTLDRTTLTAALIRIDNRFAPKYITRLVRPVVCRLQT